MGIDAPNPKRKATQLPFKPFVECEDVEALNLSLTVIDQGLHRILRFLGLIPQVRLANDGQRSSPGYCYPLRKLESLNVPVLSANNSCSIPIVRRMLRYRLDIWGSPSFQ